MLSLATSSATEVLSVNFATSDQLHTGPSHRMSRHFSRGKVDRARRKATPPVQGNRRRG
jgi:hypothetical protein